MKHKLISCLLVTTMIMTSVPVAFAMEHNQDKDSNKDASMNAVTSVMPVIAPDGFIISPSNVTILKEYLFSLATFIAVSILSVIIVLPSKLSTIPSYSFLYFTKSDATPITPSIFLIFSSFLP